mgnify:CR=1 FL=1
MVRTIVDGARWLVAPYGETDWVRNVLASTFGLVADARGRQPVLVVVVLLAGTAALSRLWVEADAGARAVAAEDRTVYGRFVLSIVPQPGTPEGKEEGAEGGRRADEGSRAVGGAGAALALLH